MRALLGQTASVKKKKKKKELVCNWKLFVQKAGLMQEPVREMELAVL